MYTLDQSKQLQNIKRVSPAHPSKDANAMHKNQKKDLSKTTNRIRGSHPTVFIIIRITLAMFFLECDENGRFSTSNDITLSRKRKRE